jgi:hypothetical protein
MFLWMARVNHQHPWLNLHLLEWGILNSGHISKAQKMLDLNTVTLILSKQWDISNIYK